MLVPKQEAQGALFYEFSTEDHVPQNHLLRAIDRFVDLSRIRPHFGDFYSHTSRPPVDPELLIRILLVAFCLGIRSEHQLREKVHLNLAYRWFCRLDLADPVPNHSTFSKNRHGRFPREQSAAPFIRNDCGALHCRRSRERTAALQLPKQDVARTPTSAPLRTKNTKTPVRSPATSPKPSNTRFRCGSEKRWKCSSHTSNAFLGLGSSDYVDHAAQMTNSFSQQTRKA